MHLLFLCTGNLCRSPIAERLIRLRAEEASGGVAEMLSVSSAGLEAPNGQAMHPWSARALARLGGDAAGFRSRRFTASLASEADLVFTMTLEQRAAVLKETPRGLRRTFTLMEAAGLLRGADLSGLADVPVGDRARDLALRLDAARALRPSTEADEISDPLGERRSIHRRTAETIDSAVRSLVAALFAQSNGIVSPAGTEAVSAPA